MSTSSIDFSQHRRMTDSFENVVRSYDKSENRVALLRISKKIHLQLIKICQDVDRAYGFQILMSIVVALSVIIGNLYVLYVILIDYHVPKWFLYNSLAMSTIWISYYSLKMVCFSAVCSFCIEQSIKTGDIINILYDNPMIDEETQNEIRDFNFQLIQKPLKFTAYGFINLDFTLIQGMMATITTYAMIMIQLDKISSL